MSTTKKPEEIPFYNAEDGNAFFRITKHNDGFIAVFGSITQNQAACYGETIDKCLIAVARQYNDCMNANIRKDNAMRLMLELSKTK